MRISKSANVCAAMLSSVCARNADPLYVGTHTLIVGLAMMERCAAGGRRALMTQNSRLRTVGEPKERVGAGAEDAKALDRCARGRREGSRAPVGPRRGCYDRAASGEIARHTAR